MSRERRRVFSLRREGRIQSDDFFEEWEMSGSDMIEGEMERELMKMGNS